MITKNDNPRFCFITPISLLDYAAWSTSHLVLAHLIDTNPEYVKFYQLRKQFGDFIMMDNSAYELKTPFSPDKLIDLGHDCGADAIVLPDYPFKHSSVTKTAAEEFIPKFKNAGFKTFFVPQSKEGDLEDWIDCYKWAADNPDIDIIGMSILGIPNALSMCHPSYARVVMVQILIERDLFNFNKHHHYLGLNSGPGLEIPSLLRMKALNTIDSSGPVWSAILGHKYSTDADSYQHVSKLTMPVDFNIPAIKNKETHSRIVHNIQLTLDLFKPKTYNQRVAWYAQE